MTRPSQCATQPNVIGAGVRGIEITEQCDAQALSPMRDAPVTETGLHAVSSGERVAARYQLERDIRSSGDLLLLMQPKPCHRTPDDVQAGSRVSEAQPQLVIHCVMKLLIDAAAGA